ncbi:unnamed protein product [Danaus chrysippus]|uniref:(African queen) hypothetical protein n=1 Tax=Danaus chrysippus TaxID=151541 RepID=A0A8J2QG55_9NEOP|nr:unnamed protein product [Danaus chrysippus]
MRHGRCGAGPAGLGRASNNERCDGGRLRRQGMRPTVPRLPALAVARLHHHAAPAAREHAHRHHAARQQHACNTRL